MKRLLLITICFCASHMMLAQESIFENQGDYVKATYYYDNGEIQQEGTFKDGKLHGTWTSYDIEGNKLSVGNYEDGLKVGKWLFWTDDTIKEVNYQESKIVDVQEYKYTRKIALRN